MNVAQNVGSALILSLAIALQAAPALAAPAPATTHTPSKVPVTHGTVSGGTQRSFGGTRPGGPTGSNGWKAPGASGSHGPTGSNGWKAPGTTYHRPVGGTVNRHGYNDHHGSYNERRIYNPRRYGAWGWHRSVAWAPDQSYWGGGFWGPLALGIVIGASVHVADNSPGRTLLSNYSLVQEQCDSNNDQVELYGPDGSVICAIPNSLVGPGRYDIDNSTLSLQPTNAE